MWLETAFPKGTVKQQLNYCYYDGNEVEYREPGVGVIDNLAELVALELGGEQAGNIMPDFDPEDDASRRSVAETKVVPDKYIYDTKMCVTEIVLMCEDKQGTLFSELATGAVAEDEMETGDKGTTSQDEARSEDDE